VIYGMNALFIFALSGLVARLMALKLFDGGTQSLKQWLYAPLQALPLSAVNASLLWALLFNAAMFAVAWFMWTRRWFIKA
jgi:predicted acyltransferase